MSSHNLIKFANRAWLAETTTHQMAVHILQNARAGKPSSLFLSGGSTPGPVYEALSRENLPWDTVKVGLVDERWVTESSAGSNAALIRKTLLQNAAKGAHFTPMKTAQKTPQQGQAAVEQNYKPLLQAPSLAILGMGTDGHVCSWFPNSDGLDAAVNPKARKAVQAIRANKSKVTGEYLDRMTLTRFALSKCQSVILLITGEEKLAVFNTALSGQNSDLPVTHLFGLSPDKFRIFYAP